MSARLFVIAVTLLLLASPALAHRLDAYLQATMIDMEQDHVALDLRLTPGVDVAQKVLAGIDVNGDGSISEVEQQAYAGRVLRDLFLAIDGHIIPLRLVSLSFPPEAAMRNGVGEIALTFSADLPPDGRTHKLTFENHHESAIAVYLVNTLLPHDPGVRILGQDRNYDQSAYRLDFVSDGTTGPSTMATSSGGQQRPDWQDTLPIVETFFWHGVHHILTGYDHLLFVSALVLGAATLWDLVKVVTAFTVAHSITLTLAALNLVHLSETVVEPLISASIVFVAIQNIVAPNRSRGWSRLAVAFLFGLVHGLGFADGLLDLMHQMPKGTILLAVLGFSLGVEAGNQMLLLPLFGLLKAVRHSQPDIPLQARLFRSLQRIGSVGVSAAGTYYLCLALTGIP
jgi:hydrogenase/urease accessory protein HupE